MLKKKFLWGNALTEWNHKKYRLRRRYSPASGYFTRRNKGRQSITVIKKLYHTSQLPNAVYPILFDYQATQIYLKNTSSQCKGFLLKYESNMEIMIIIMVLLKLIIIQSFLQFYWWGNCAERLRTFLRTPSNRVMALRLEPW